MRDDDGEDDRAEDGNLDEVAESDSQDVAEEIAEQVGYVPIDRAEQQHPQGERTRKEHADRRVESEPAPARHDADRERRADGGHGTPDVQGCADDVGDDETRERRMADRIADEGEALQHDEGPHDRAYHPD